MNDADLLGKFQNNNDQDAFRQLVEEHSSMVFAVCRRDLGDESLAQDAAQTVFIILAQKAKQVKAKALSSWLFSTSRLVVKNMKRVEARRKKHEAKVAEMKEKVSISRETEAQWEEISPFLNNAVNALGKKQKEAVIRYFLENKPQNQVARELDCSEDAVKMRVSRGIKDLRKILSKKGMVLPGAVLSGLLASNAVEAAPAALSGACVSASMAALAGNTAGIGSLLYIAKGVTQMMMWIKIKLAVVCICGLAAVGSLATIAAQNAADDGQPAAEVKKEHAEKGGGNTLDVSLKVIPQTWPVPEKGKYTRIALLLGVKNTDTESIRVAPISPSMLILTNASGTPFKMKFWGADKSRMLASMDFPVIKPGSLKTLKLYGGLTENRMLWLSETTGGSWQSHSPLPDGEYTVSVLYKNSKKELPEIVSARGDKNTVKTLWTGAVSSGKETISVGKASPIAWGKPVNGVQVGLVSLGSDAGKGWGEGNSPFFCPKCANQARKHCMDPSSAASKRICAVCSTPKPWSAAFTQGEPISFEMHIRNVSGKPKKLKGKIHQWQDQWKVVFTPQTGGVPRTPRWKGPAVKRAPLPDLTLAENQHMVILMNFGSPFQFDHYSAGARLATAAPIKNLGPGTYTLTAAYSYAADPDSIFWHGTVAAAPLKIEIKKTKNLAGKPVKGIIFSIKADRTDLVMTPLKLRRATANTPRYKVEQARIKLSFKNVSNKPIRLNTYDLTYSHMSLDVTGPDRKSVLVKKLFVDRSMAAPTKESFPLVQPGKTYDHHYQFSFPGMFAGKSYNLMKPGAYRLTITYSAAKAKWAHTDEIKKLQNESWKGKIKSNEITLNCLPPNGGKLEMDLSISPIQWKPGVKVNVTCTVRNVSKKPQRFLAWGVEFANTLEISDLRSGGVVRMDGGRDATRKLTIDAYPLIQPGASKKFTIQGTLHKVNNGIQFRTPEQMGGILCWNLTQGGMYSVKAVLHITKDNIKRYPQNLQKEKDTLWTGKIFSKPVTVRIPGQLKKPEDIF